MDRVHSTTVVKVSELLRVFQSWSEDPDVQGLQQMLETLLSHCQGVLSDVSGRTSHTGILRNWWIW